MNQNIMITNLKNVYLTSSHKTAHTRSGVDSTRYLNSVLTAEPLTTAQW